MSELISLGDLGDFKNGVNFSKEKMGEGIPVINVKNITDHHYLYHQDFDEVKIELKADDLSEMNDIFFVRSSVKRDGVGLVGKFKSEVPEEGTHCGFVIRFRPYSEKINSNYLLYLLLSPLYREKIKNLSSGTTIINLSQGALRTLKVPLPPLPTQKRIADILSAYDDLIENNKRRIALLEQAARHLYKEWFVRFKFPGHEKVKVVDGVPEGWERKTLGEVCEVLPGYAFKSKDWQAEGNPVIKIKNITANGNVDTEDCQYINDNVAEKASKFIIPPGTLIIAMTGATIGKIGIMPKSSGNCYLNQRVAMFKSKFGFSITPYVYSFFSLPEIQTTIINTGGGAAQPNISGGQIERLNMVVPPIHLLKIFCEDQKSIFNFRLNLIEQNMNYQIARDLLLPRLINGDLKV